MPENGTVAGGRLIMPENRGPNFRNLMYFPKTKVTDFFLKWRFQSDKSGVFGALCKKMTVKRALPIIRI